MPIIDWCVELSVGIEEVDNDHKRLIALFNEAHKKVEQTAPRDDLERILTELIDYTDWHFDHEEKLMDDNRYARAEEHKLEHRELAENAKELHKQFLAGDDTVPDVLLPFLRNWLTNHIMRSDKLLGDFLNGYRRREF